MASNEARAVAARVVALPVTLVATLAIFTTVAMSNQQVRKILAEGAYNRALKKLARFVTDEANGKSGKWPSITQQHPDIEQTFFDALGALVPSYASLTGEELSEQEVLKLQQFVLYLVDKRGLEPPSKKRLATVIDACKQTDNVLLLFGHGRFWKLVSTSDMKHFLLPQIPKDQHMTHILKALAGLEPVHKELFSTYQCSGNEQLK